MTLRNLNQRKPRGRILGTPKTGVLGALIPSTGVNGPGYAYPSLSLPADAGKEICGYITAWPAAGVLDAGENTGFTFDGAPDSTYQFQFQLQADGVDQGTPRTAVMTQSTPGTIVCIAGDASAVSPNATITQSGLTTISCQIAAASAVCPPAGISQFAGTLVLCQTGNASASCPSATISQAVATLISCQVGSATASGPIANITITPGVVWPAGVPTVAQFREDFPEFADPAKYPDAQIRRQLIAASNILSEMVWDTSWGYGIELRTAHYLTIGARNAAAVAAGGAAGGVSGLLTSKSVDKVSAGYDIKATTYEGAGFWNTTAYGIEFWQLVMMFGAGPVQL